MCFPFIKRAAKHGQLNPISARVWPAEPADAEVRIQGPTIGLHED
jgi:hypothetical protein